MCCTSYESSNYGRGRCGRLSRNHRLNMQWSSPVCNTILFCRRWLIYGNAQSAPKAIDASLPPSELIADAVKRSSRAHMFHFYSCCARSRLYHEICQMRGSRQIA